MAGKGRAKGARHAGICLQRIATGQQVCVEII
jgi:hypothetical protein